MKKILGIVSSLGLITTATTSVVSCEKKEENENQWNGDDIKDFRQWELKDYTSESTKNKGIPNIWITSDKIKNDKVNFTDKELSLMIWTGILNADDGEGGSAHSDFNEKKLERFLTFTGPVNDILNDHLKDWKKESKDKETIKILIDKSKAERLGMKLTRDVITRTSSKDKDGNYNKIGLKSGKTQFSKGLTINIIQK